MKKLNINFEHCYGIKKLAHTFDFSAKKTFAIYAPNGIMKTSFAKTFMDFSKKEKSKDLVFGHIKSTERSITDESGIELNSTEVFVIEPYNEKYKSSNVSTLLANKELKEEYDKILGSIEDKKKLLIKELIPLLGLKHSSKTMVFVEETFSADFTPSKNFFKALMRVKDEVLSHEDGKFASIKYCEIFNEKVLEFLKENEAQLENYTKRYEELIGASKYFKKGVFNHNNAIAIAKNLKENGFFKANHTVIFSCNNISEKKEFATEADLENAIQSEMDSILSDKTLLKSFEDIDKKLNKNEELRKFRDYLINNLYILPELKDLRLFKENIWISYLKSKKTFFVDLETEYSAGRTQIEQILSKAKADISAWVDVIDIFNKRFFVPFVIQIENQEDVILKSEAPNFKFYFAEEGQYKAPIEEEQLLKALSTGEKRALYILNIVFEVEARKRNGQQTLFIVDDIADSFDYKNKYAIIEYLKDISNDNNFKQIILSHNFDFYRSVSKRLGLPRTHKLHAIRNNTDIRLVQEKYQKNPFMHWKEHLDNDIMLIASIPFVRNLVEYSGDKATEDKLTSLLHIKSDTKDITLQDLFEIYSNVLVNPNIPTVFNPLKKVLDLIYECGDKIFYNALETTDLENKIVLSVCIRLKAEEYMLSVLDLAPNELQNITSEQTFQLFSKFKKEYAARIDIIKILEQVNLMTPENIHINSFMYEPLLDMSDLYLKELYDKVRELS